MFEIDWNGEPSKFAAKWDPEGWSLGSQEYDDPDIRELGFGSFGLQVLSNTSVIGVAGYVGVADAASDACVMKFEQSARTGRLLYTGELEGRGIVLPLVRPSDSLVVVRVGSKRFPSRLLIGEPSQNDAVVEFAQGCTAFIREGGLSGVSVAPVVNA